MSIFMHAFMYACMHVCMYACMHVCMYYVLDGYYMHTYDEPVETCTCMFRACMQVPRSYVCIDKLIYVCMHVCTFITFIHVGNF